MKDVSFGFEKNEIKTQQMRKLHKRSNLLMYEVTLRAQINDSCLTSHRQEGVKIF